MVFSFVSSFKAVALCCFMLRVVAILLCRTVCKTPPINKRRWPAISLLLAFRNIYGDKAAFFGSFLGYRKERPRFRFFFAIRRIYADKVASFGSFLGYRKEHSRVVFFAIAAFTPTKLPLLIQFWTSKSLPSVSRQIPAYSICIAVI